MTTTDWVLDITLLALVLLQIREDRFGRRAFLLPLALVGWSAAHYVTALPTAGNDVLLVALFTTVGVALGIAGGLTTKVRTDGGRYALVRAGFVPAALWVASMGFRLGFVLWITHPSGAAHLATFSMHHDITSAAAWQDGLLLMALSEVLLRVGILKVRTTRAVGRQQAPVAAPERVLVSA